MKEDKKIIKTRISQMRLREDNIIHSIILPDMEVTENDAWENILSATKVSPEENYKILIDMRKVRSISYQARKVFSEQSNAKAIALMVDSYLSKTIANFFLGMNKTKASTRLFTAEKEALKWLKRFTE